MFLGMLQSQPNLKHKGKTAQKHAVLTAQKHAVFVKPISCTDRWFHAILKTKDFFYTPSRAAFFNFFIPEPHFMLSMNCRTALTSILHP
jgi:hypothetical protein